MDDALAQWLTSHLLAYESGYGLKAVLKVIRQIASRLGKLGMENAHHKLKGAYFSGRVFESYEMRIYGRARSSIVRALVSDPSLLTNWGLVSVFFHTVPFLERFAG
jgi:hypothetical protein